MNKQATRHDLEEKLWWKRDAFWNINRENLSLSKEAQKEFKEMCQEYVAEKISQVEFQNRFNNFVKVRLWLPEEQQFVATNVLEKLDAITLTYGYDLEYRKVKKEGKVFNPVNDGTEEGSKDVID